MFFSVVMTGNLSPSRDRQGAGFRAGKRRGHTESEFVSIGNGVQVLEALIDSDRFRHMLMNS